MPITDSVETWMDMPYIIRISRICIRYTDQYYSHRDIESTYYNVKSSTKSDLSRKKCRIYELLAQVTKGKMVHNRSMDIHTFFKEIFSLKILNRTVTASHQISAKRKRLI